MLSHLNTDKYKKIFYNLSTGSKNTRDNGSITLLKGKEITRKPNSHLKKKNTLKLHFGREYSQMFLETGPSNIFNTDEKKVEILKSGVALTLLFNDKRLCIVCYQEIPKNLQLLYEHLFNINHIHILNQIINNNLQFINFPNQFSDYSLGKEFMKEINEDIIFCFACKTEISNNDYHIRNHILNDKNHISKSQYQREQNEKIFKIFSEQFENTWYIVQRFWCQLCNEKFKYDIDFANHLGGYFHLKQVNELISNNIDMCYDICTSCASMFVGNPHTYTLHCHDGLHKYLNKSKDYAVPEMAEDAKNVLHNLEEIAEKLVLESNETISSEKNIDLVLKSLEQAIKLHYPTAKAHIFGSRVSHLAFCDSDVDIFLDCGNAYNGMQSLSKIREYLLNSQKCFESQPDVWELREVLLNTRAPIIRVDHRKLGLKCDISFTSGLTVEKTKLIKLFMMSNPLLRKMVLFLKKWLNVCSLIESQGLTTFGITWFVIFYFQQIKILPSVAELMKKKTESKIIDGWETGFAQEISINSSSLTFKELLIGFFEFYANYDYRFCVISPLMGHSLNKQDFTDNCIDYLPVEIEGYKLYVKSTKNQDIFRVDSPLCLQDPIDLVQNITRSVSKMILRSFKQYCQTSYEILNNKSKYPKEIYNIF